MKCMFMLCLASVQAYNLIATRRYARGNGGNMSEEKKKRGRMFEKVLPEETREHLDSARKEMRESVESFLPPGFVEHRRAARRHMLLAFRSLIDAALDRVAPVEKGK